MPPKVKPSKTIDQAQTDYDDDILINGVNLTIDLSVICSNTLTFKNGADVKKGNFFDYVDVYVDGHLESEGSPDTTVSYYEGSNAAPTKIRYLLSMDIHCPVILKRTLVGSYLLLDHKPLNIKVIYYYHGHSAYEQTAIIDLNLKVPFQKNHTFNTVIGLSLEGEKRLKEAAKTYV